MDHSDNGTISMEYIQMMLGARDITIFQLKRELAGLFAENEALRVQLKAASEDWPQPINAVKWDAPQKEG
jgi:hypothetical protein